MRYCPQCGAQARDTDTFCNKCGTELDKTNSLRAPEHKLPGQNQSIVAAMIIVTMIIIASFAGIILLTNQAEPDTNYHVTFDWKYDSHPCNFTLDISMNDYSKIVSSDINRNGTQSSDRYFRTDSNGNIETVFGVNDYIVVDNYIKDVAISLKSIYNKYYPSSVTDAPEFATFVAWFVQANVEYQSDIDAKGQNEYWKYPIETLFDKKGDCEDTSILMAAILNASNITGASGYNAGVFILPEHVMCAIDSTTLSKVYSNVHSLYYPIESTSAGTDIGVINSVYVDCFFHLYTGYSTEYYYQK